MRSESTRKFDPPKLEHVIRIRLLFWMVLFFVHWHGLLGAENSIALEDTIPVFPHGLGVEDLGKQYNAHPLQVPAYLSANQSDMGGTTSVRRADSPNLTWKTEGYYQRNRELGQVFNVPVGTFIQIDAIVLRTGNSSNAVQPGAPGADVYLQFFEVVGSPVINDNGTPKGTPSTHGFSTNHRTDDFLEGIVYKPIAIVRGGTFPDFEPTTQNGGQAGHLRYMRWDLKDEAEITLAGGKRYAFMVGFTQDGPKRGFSLGNNNQASSTDVPALRKDADGAAWWSIRREGDGTLPPTQFPGASPPQDEPTRQLLVKAALFSSGHELMLSPTTDGFPDVDSYRTLEFYIELVNNCAPAGNTCDDGNPDTENDLEDGFCNCYGAPVNGCEAHGKILYRRFDNLTGLSVEALKSSPRFPADPDQVLYQSSFEAPSNIRDNYGVWMSGYLCPPITGNYTFWIAGDDNVAFHLSTDDLPANTRRIAYHNGWTSAREWNKYPTQQSSPVFLQAGQFYYAEAFMKESGGGDNIAVGWQLPDGRMERPISGAYLSTVPNCPKAGTHCDDGNANTINDQENGLCECTGTNICPPVGIPCDDGNSFTENDLEDGQCNCIGKTIFSRGLELSGLGKNYQRDPERTPDYLFFSASDQGGSTSVRSVDGPNLEWKTSGYFQRNRDLGQTFFVPQDTVIKIDAVVLRTGNSAGAVKNGALAAPVYLQLFEIKGSPVINDNNTPPGTPATHGFTTNHRADDYLEGIDYETLLVADGGYFPLIGTTNQNGDQPAHLHYIRWDLLGDNAITLAGGKRYAFLVGFKDTGPNRGFTLGNVNRAADPAAPALSKDLNGHGWWSFRREGNGTLPPTQVPGTLPPANPVILKQLINESLFQPAHPYLLSPTTDGFPDVDTYRTLEFYIEVKKADVINSVGKIVANPSLRIFPNPSSGQVQITFQNTGFTDEAVINIRNIFGQTLFSQSVTTPSGWNSLSVDVQHLAGKGLMYIVITTPQGQMNGKIIIQ